ncbi:hypothetical protein [Bacillus toyonensis]|uniref:hypothetical protein n=1 Tax=Bacillus toyonensis TaxID=155322 RepID=UPI000BF1FCBE|nr:hypothetical protein [Bacillus toyonensis]PEN62346.1 hypothetical protein CN545_30025 [Bacillus toyonensis]
MSKKEIGKNLGELKFEFATLEKPKCSSVVQKSAMIEGTEPTEDSKYFIFGLFKNGDCEIREQKVTIFSDGQYEHKATIHNYGIVLGDTIVVDVYFYKDQTLVASFQWHQHLNAGETQSPTIHNREINIKTFWSQINKANFSISCLL